MTSPELAERADPTPARHRRRVVAHGRDLPDLPALLRRQLRRRHRRPPRRHRAPRRPRRPRRRRDLAEPVPALAAEGRRLRRRRLLRRRPALRHAGRLRRDAGRGASRAASASSSTWSRTTPPTSTSGSSRRSPPRPAAASARATSSATARARPANCPRTTGSPSSAGPAWTRVVEADGTPGQWYLHLFDSSQPDFDWSNEEVREEFRRILRFWLDRGRRRLPRRRRARPREAGRPSRLRAADGCRLDGRRRVRRPVLGPRRRARDLPRLAQRRRGVRRRPRAVRRGVAAHSRADRALGAPRRDAPGVQLRLPRDGMGCRGPPRRHHRVARGVRRGGRAEHLGALEPRRRAPRVASRADRREPAGTRHRPGLARQADPRGRPAPRARRDDAHARRCPARRTCTRARSWDCPRSSTSPTRCGRIRPGSARPASATAATAAACRCRGPRRVRPTASARPARPGCRSRASGRRSRATCRSPTRRRRSRSTAALLGAAPRARPGSRDARPGSTASGTDAVAFRNGNVTVVANLGSAADPAPGRYRDRGERSRDRRRCSPSTRRCGSRAAELRRSGSSGEMG